MPLSEKDSRKLTTDLAKYIEEEKKWLVHDVDKLEREGKLKKEAADELRKRQEQANRNRQKLEERITKTIVARFPSSFGGVRAKKKEAEPKVEEIIIPAAEPSVIEVPKKVLERINTGIEAQAAYFSSYEEIAKAQLEASNALKAIAEENRALHENIYEIVYPASGGEVLIPAGETVLDLWTGDVYLGDGTTGMLSDSLSRLGQLYVRSIYVDTKKPFSVQLDGKAKHTVAADDFFARKGIQCRRVFIDVDEPTSLKFWSSTNPDASLNEARRTVTTGEDTWKYLSTDTVTASGWVRVTIHNILENKRLRLESISITCSKSCIQVLDVSITKAGVDAWRRYRYDMQGLFNFYNVILTANDELKVYYDNRSGESLYFDIEVLGVQETV